MILLFLLAAFGQIADQTTFALAVARHGPLGEANPFVRFLYEHAGTLGVSAFKIGFLIAMILTCNWMVNRGVPVWLPATILVFAGVVGIVGATTNIIAISR